MTFSVILIIDPVASEVNKNPDMVNDAAAAAAAVTEKTTTTATVTEADKECTWKEMGNFKEALLMFYCQKFVEPDCKVEVKTGQCSSILSSFGFRRHKWFIVSQTLFD